MKDIKVILFDVDGVLLDSLTPHLKICEDKNEEYGLGLKIPNASEFKKMVRAGIQISPMKYFFTAVGFPEKFAEKANQQYQQIFLEKYSPRPFLGMHQTLQALRADGFQLGIVTSNVKANVLKALGKTIELFCAECVLSKEDMVDASKSQAITKAVLTFHVKPEETIYVGDQPADWQAAKAAGVKFLGVTYGWGISEDDTEFPVVENLSEIYRYIHHKYSELEPPGFAITPRS